MSAIALVRDDGERFVVGDDAEILCTITLVPVGQEITKAWFTLKRRKTDADVAALVQKAVTATDVPGTGQITDTGLADQTAAVRFDIPAVNSTAIPSGRAWPWDVQIKLTGGKIVTIAHGTMTWQEQITVEAA